MALLIFTKRLANHQNRSLVGLYLVINIRAYFLKITPYNSLEEQVKWNPETGEILEIYDQPTGKTDAIAMQHDVDYSVCKDDKACKHKADRKMVQS